MKCRCSPSSGQLVRTSSLPFSLFRLQRQITRIAGNTRRQRIMNDNKNSNYSMALRNSTDCNQSIESVQYNHNITTHLISYLPSRVIGRVRKVTFIKFKKKMISMFMLFDVFINVNNTCHKT